MVKGIPPVACYMCQSIFELPVQFLDIIHEDKTCSFYVCQGCIDSAQEAYQQGMSREGNC